MLVPLLAACTAVGPIDDPEATSSSGADSTPTDDGHSSTAGTTASTTANVSATDSDTATTGNGDPITGPGDNTDGPDPSGTTGSETSTSTGVVTGFDTAGKDTLLEICGIEPPDGPVGTGQIQCGCDSCALDWFDVDQALYDAISPQCACLCEAAGCGGWQGSEATSVDGEEATGDDVNDTGDPSTTGGNAE